MSGSGVGARMVRFAERYSIDRKRAAIAGGLLASVLIVSLFVMNQRIQARRAIAQQGADSIGLASPLEPVEQVAERAAWADPREARKLAGDTLPSIPAVDSAAGGEYVPLGREVGPGGYDRVERGDPFSNDSAAGGGYDFRYDPGEPRPATPEEVRRAAFQRAVAARQLRPARRAEADSSRDMSEPAAVVAPVSGAELKPYGPEQVEADRQAAEEAAQKVGEGPRAAAGKPRETIVTFASYYAARPCGEGERVLSPGMITATLVSSVNSEHPGPVFARIGRDVWDAALRCVILPAGTLLVGRYPEGLGIAETRLVVLWEQVVLGDGRTWALPSFPVGDRQGAAGVPGKVDRRTREIFESAAVLSAFGAALEYATPASESTAAGPVGYPTAPSARDRAVGAAAEPFRNAAGRLLDRATSVRPVLRLQPGQPIAVIVPAALDLDRPAPAPAPAPSVATQPFAPTT